MNGSKIIFAVIGLIAVILLIDIFAHVLKFNLHRIWFPDLYEKSMGNYKFKVNPKCVSDKRIVITGVCRNCALSVEKHINTAVILGGYFKEYKIVLFENDSNDGTRTIIKNLAVENPNIHLIECSEAPDCKFNEINLYSAGDHSAYRIDKMAFYRNKYMDYIVSNFSDYDYLIVQDWDLQGVLQIENVINSICSGTNWDGIAANGLTQKLYTLGLLTKMYDTLAFSYDETQSHSINEKEKIMADIAKLNDPVKVYSAFNGLTIYKISSIVNKRYLTGWKCEHISLNAQLNNFYLDPHLEIFVGCQGSSVYQKITRILYPPVITAPLPVVVQEQESPEQQIWNEIAKEGIIVAF